MARVGILVDSICCLPPELIKEFNIRKVPLHLSVNNKAYRDGVDITPEQFWKLFPTMKEFSTGAPPVGEIAKLYEEIGQSTPDICCITVSKVLSATHEAFVEAAKMAAANNPRLKIEVIDSKTAAGAQGFITLEAARAARAGKSLAEVVQAAQAMIPRVKMLLALDTLKYLIKIGRAPKTAYLGELFQVKPLIGMVNGSGLVENLGRARGKEKAMATLRELVKAHTDTTKPLHVNVHYTNSIADGEELKKRVTSKYNCVEVYVTDFTPVMSGAVGPVVGMTFYS